MASDNPAAARAVHIIDDDQALREFAGIFAPGSAARSSEF